MTQYIDKDTLVEYINFRYLEHQTGNQPIGCLNRMNEDKEILSYLNTLEVKEVDLEKEIDFAMPSKYCWSGDGEAVYSKEQMRNFAKHFFELGLKAQKGVENEKN